MLIQARGVLTWLGLRLRGSVLAAILPLALTMVCPSRILLRDFCLFRVGFAHMNSGESVFARWHNSLVCVCEKN